MVLGLVHHHHDVVGRLVVDHQLAVAFVDAPSCRILYLLEKGIGVGTLLIVIAGNLEHEEPDDVDHHNEDGHTGYHKASIVQAIVPHHRPPAISTSLPPGYK